MVCARASTSVPRFASVGTRPGFPASCPNDRPVPASRAADYFRLRTAHRIIGAMVGGLPGFRQQDAVHGLPLQLSPEEVTLAVDEGWVELYELDDPPESYAFGEPGTSGGEGPSTTKPPQNRRHTAACRPRDGAPNPSLRTTPSESKARPRVAPTGKPSFKRRTSPYLCVATLQRERPSVRIPLPGANTDLRRGGRTLARPPSVDATRYSRICTRGA